MEPEWTKSAVATTQAVILAVETSSRVGSVALARGETLLAETVFSATLRHSVEILPAISRLLERFAYTPDNIDQVHIALGPGSFTGLRIAAALAKTMSLANAVRIVAVDSLDVITANINDADDLAVFQNAGVCLAAVRVATILDAKRGQFYAAVYERVGADGPAKSGRSEGPDYDIPAPVQGLWRKIVPDRLMTAGEVLTCRGADGCLGVLGDGLLYHRDAFRADGVLPLDERLWSPRAANVHRLGYQKALIGRFADPVTLVPLYLRGPQVTLKQRR
jgi:tRNA threonylcarbamoyl adenosine modification protein YeaZ